MRKASTRLPEQGTQTPSPAPDLIPAKTKNQSRTHSAIGTANGGTSSRPSAEKPALDGYVKQEENSAAFERTSITTNQRIWCRAGTNLT